MKDIGIEHDIGMSKRSNAHTTLVETRRVAPDSQGTLAKLRRVPLAKGAPRAPRVRNFVADVAAQRSLCLTRHGDTAHGTADTFVFSMVTQIAGAHLTATPEVFRCP
ncbi:unnamed protein product, partial [Iphiclides podalirius]